MSRRLPLPLPRPCPAAVRLGLLAAMLAAATRGQDLDARVQETLARARQPLLDHLQQTLTAEASHPGLLGLLALAAVHDGVPADEPVLRSALETLSAFELNQTYDLALRLLVLEACPGVPDRKAIAAADCKRLLRHRDDGAFGYTQPSDAWDLSNTQYAALGLRAAASLGVDVPRRVWTALADTTIEAQHDDGGFGYRAGGGYAATASMTVAGIAVLAICRQALQRPNRSLPELDRRIETAWTWLDRHANAIGAPTQPWSYYFHYGLERAAILTDVVQVGGKPWYGTGADMLVAAQQRGGGWASATDHGPGAPLSGDRGQPVSTAFAVLFLRRKFQKVAGPVTPERLPTLAQLDEQSPADAIERCADGLVRRGKPALAEVLAALRDPLAPRRRAALLALRALAGEDFGIDPALPPEQNAEGLKRAELWYLRNR